MGVLTIEEKLIPVEMLKLEVGRKGLRADVPQREARESERREREREREEREV